MKRLLVFLLMITMILPMSACKKEEPEEDNSNVADTVIFGTIYTADEKNSRVEAMAIKDGTILYTGDRQGVYEYIGDGTEITDYSDSFIMPGFIDGNSHSYIDAEHQVGINLSDCKEQSQEAYIEAIRNYIDEHPDDTFYRGYGWSDNAFIGTPTAAMLDEICSSKPIYLVSEDYHSCWINTKMLELTGVTAWTLNPVGGTIVRDGFSNPTGCFRYTAMDYLVKPYVPSYSVEEYEKILLNEQEKMLALGYTAYEEVIIDPQDADNICEAYYNLEQEEKLPVNVNAGILINNTENYIEDLDHIVELCKKYNGDKFRISDVKINMDGDVESRTAYVSYPYTYGGYGNDRWYGLDSTNRLNDLITRINDEGLVAHFHAVGDAAISKALDAIQYARENSECNDIRNCITHLQMISDEEIQRMKDLDVIAIVEFANAPSTSEEVDGNQNTELLNVGEVRNNEMYPFKTMLNAGITMSYASNYPVASNNDPFYSLQSAVTRQILNYTSTLRNEEERLNIEEAIQCMTVNGAYQLQREEEIGSLEVGKSADFIVLNQDITKIDTKTISSTTSLLLTYVSGERVHKAD